MTAAHNVFDPSIGGHAEHIVVIPGRDGSSAPFGRFDVVHRSLPARYLEQHDFAALRLARSDTQALIHLGFFSVAAPADSALLWQVVHVCGYSNQLQREVSRQYHCTGWIGGLSASHLDYAMTGAWGGLSGAPLWITNAVTGEPRVVGIHARGPDNKHMRSGSRIGLRVLKTTEHWIEADTNAQ